MMSQQKTYATESRKSRKSILLLSSFRSTLLVFLFAFPVLADLSLNITSSRPSIYLGETFNLTVEVNGADSDVDAPDLSALQAAEIQFLGQHSNSRSSISIINGHMTREVYKGRIFSYQIKPSSEGLFKAGPIRVTADGKSHVHPGVTVRVAGIEKQSTVVAAVTASSTTVLVEEPFTVTLSVAVAELPDPYAENNEPIHPNSPPQISADFLEIKQDLPGLKGPDLNQVLNSLIDQTGNQPSFAINNYQTRDRAGFQGFFDNDPFHPRPIRFRLSQKKITIDNKKYRDYTLSLTYTPTKEGEFTFGPLSFKGTVISDVTSDRKAVTKDVYTIGPAVTVRVVPPPDEGRPEWFIGSVGKNMKATAAFDTTVCKVGDPLTLTLELTGAISVSNLRTPILNLQPELTKDFRIYDENATSDTLPNGKRFKYRIRPMHEGTLEFPPIKVAYFDTEAKAYKTITSQPVPIQAQATTQIAAEMENGKDDQALSANMQTRPFPSGITLSAEGTHPDTLLPPLRVSLLLLFMGPLLCLFAALHTPLRRAVSSWRANRRRSGALHRAHLALRRAKTADLIAHAVRTYLSERLNVSGTALTPSDAADLLRKRNVPDADAAACRERLAQLDEAMYRPDASVPLADIVRDLHPLLTQLDAALDSPPSPLEELP